MTVIQQKDERKENCSSSARHTQGTKEKACWPPLSSWMPSTWEAGQEQVEVSGQNSTWSKTSRNLAVSRVTQRQRRIFPGSWWNSPRTL